MSAAKHHEWAAFLVTMAESEAVAEQAVRLAEIAAWHAQEAENKALAAVDSVPAAAGPSDESLFS